MTLYALNDITPKTPANGDYWVAPGAHVIGDIEISEGVGIWFGVTCAATVKGSRSAQARTCRKTPSCIPMRAFR